MIMYRQSSCICLYANEGRESKTKDSVCNTHLNFGSFFSGKKCALYKGKYGIEFLVILNNPAIMNIFAVNQILCYNRVFAVMKTPV